MTDLHLPPQRPLRDPEARRRALVRELRSSRPRRRWLFAAPFVVAALAGGGAVAGGILDGEDVRSAAVLCHAEGKLRSKTAEIRLGLMSEGRTPQQLCGDYFRSGQFGDGQVHGLQVCAHQREVHVFPGDRGTCAKLGLERIDGAEVAREEREREALSTAIVEAAGECLAPRRAGALIARELTAAGREGWTIEVTGGDRCVKQFRLDWGQRVATARADKGLEPGEFVLGADRADVSEFSATQSMEAVPISPEDLRKQIAKQIPEVCGLKGDGIDRVINELACDTVKYDARNFGPKSCRPMDDVMALARRLVREHAPKWRVEVDEPLECYIDGQRTNDGLRVLTLQAGRRP